MLALAPYSMGLIVKGSRQTKNAAALEGTAAFLILLCRKARGEATRLARWAQSSRRKCGKSSTSRMFGLSVSSMIRRSMPIPQPPVGGMPYSSARM
ncbi:hypothetical protein PAP18089_01238 [Pandoraea apista]|uniref:Uncharacterized protein n=1 Tax=Pandoraea apista TaxID=93218 RepID=A0A5E5P130_9BURK|nr:hypothetical protein PAP18089_01238 [Pandoraea apista]